MLGHNADVVAPTTLSGTLELHLGPTGLCIFFSQFSVNRVSLPANCLDFLDFFAICTAILATLSCVKC